MTLALSGATLVSTPSCSRRTVSLEGRACDQGTCLDGYACHPETNLCVAAFATDCDADPSTCPSKIGTGDVCPSAGSFVPCIDSVGDCSAGCRTCGEDGTWSACSTPPCRLGSVWSCGSCDDDCRVRVQHVTGIFCNTVATPAVCAYVGDCDPGYVDATGGAADGCECALTNDGTERCDGIDNDCDGVVDDGFSIGQPCGVGACAGGVFECAADGESSVCSTEAGGSESRVAQDVCDGIDNDCDGLVDEDFLLGEPCGVGACAGGVYECDAMQLGMACSTEAGGSDVRGSAEVCDGFDDDCDGVIDNGFVTPCSCTVATVRACNAGSWPTSGVQTCKVDGTWDTCSFAYSHRLKLTLDNASLASPLADFPVLVVLDSTRISYTDFAAGGADLVFLDADGHTVLPHEIERWDPSGSSYVWVKVPEVAAGPTEDFVWLYYGNPQATDAQDAAGVWSPDYVAVWHLEEDQAGTGTVGLYVDSTGQGHDGTDGVASTTKTGRIGRGQGFGRADALTVADEAALSPTDALTVEMWATGTSDFFAYRKSIGVTPAPAVGGFQLEVTLTAASFDYAAAAADGSDLRFVIPASGTPLSYWIERWSYGGTSTVWVRVPSGTTSVALLYGNASAVTQSNAFGVLDAGNLWMTAWNSAPGDFTNFDAAYATLTYASAAWSGPGLSNALYPSAPVGTVFCYYGANSGYCNPTGQQDYYSVLFEGWVDLPASGDWTFYTWSDDASDAYFDAPDWKSSAGASCLVGNYGYHSWTASGSVCSGFPGGLHRYQFRMQENTVDDGYLDGYALPGTTTVVYPMPASWHYYRKRQNPQPVTSVSTTATRVGVGVAKAGSYALEVSGSMVRARVNTQSTSTTLPVGWHQLALVYDRTRLALYADGNSAATVGYTAAVTPTTSDLAIGDLYDDILAQSGPLDEVRISRVARSAAWLHAQVASMSDAFLTYGAPEAL